MSAYKGLIESSLWRINEFKENENLNGLDIYRNMYKFLNKKESISFT